MSLFSRKHFSWLKSCYNLLGRKFKKNIAKLIIVHPSFIINAGFMFARPFISSKFWKKLHRESSITNVGKILNLVQPLKVAPVVYKYEGSYSEFCGHCVAAVNAIYKVGGAVPARCWADERAKRSRSAPCICSMCSSTWPSAQ